MIKKVLAAIGIIAMMATAQGTGTAGDPWLIGEPTAADVKAVFNSMTGTLTISGKGDMKHYLPYVLWQPWRDVSDSIITVNIEDGVTNIGNSVFSDYIKLTSVSIPNSVTSIGNSAFFNCRSLTSITIPNSITSIGSVAFADCKGLTSITIPSSVTSIGESAFAGSGLTSITIPNSITSIEDGMFNECIGLISVSIPNSVTSIGRDAFRDCKSLTSITIPNSVTSIGESAFLGCEGLISLTIPNSVTSIGDNAFLWCSGLTSINIGTGLTSVKGLAFDAFNKLEAINVDSGNTAYSSIEGILYDKDKKTLIRCPMGKKGEVIIPNSVKNIEKMAFQNCSSLTSVTIPNSVTHIDQYTFMGCIGLTSITIGKGVTSIRSDAFRGCTGLTSVISLNPTPPEASFPDVNKTTCVLYVPKGSIDAYRSDAGWKGFENITEFVVNITTEIKDTVFRAEIYRKIGKVSPDTIYNTDVDTITSLNLRREAGRVRTVTGAAIKDLSGIEYFTVLKILDVSGHEIETLDLSNNTQLVTLNVEYNKISELDLTGLTQLQTLSISNNNFTSIDKIIGIENTQIDIDDFDLGNQTTSIANVKKSGNKAMFKSNIVSDKMEIMLDGRVSFVVYDMTGNVVYRSKGEKSFAPTWDLRNSAGRFVANGTYLVVVEAREANGKVSYYSAKIGVKR